MSGKPLVGYADKGVKPRPKPLPVKKVNAERGGHRFPEHVNQPLRDFVRTLPCILTGLVSSEGHAHRCYGDIMVCHLKTRGSGAPDDENVFPGCLTAHTAQEGRTKQFEMTWPVRVKGVCRRVTATFYKAAGLKAAEKKRSESTTKART